MNLSKKLLICLIGCLILYTPALAGYNVTTLSELQAGVRYLVATDADPYHPNDTLTYFINMACREVAAYGVIIRMDSVVVSAEDRVKDLNVDCIEVKSVFPCSTMGVKAYDRVAFNDWGQIGAATQATKTQYWDMQRAFVSDSSGGLLHGAKLWLYPAHSGVDDTLLVEYYAQANELTVADDTTNIPYEYTNLVIYYTLSLTLARSKNHNEAAWWKAFYEQEAQKKGLLKQLDFIVKPKVIE